MIKTLVDPLGRSRSATRPQRARPFPYLVYGDTDSHILAGAVRHSGGRREGQVVVVGIDETLPHDVRQIVRIEVPTLWSVIACGCGPCSVVVWLGSTKTPLLPAC